MNFGAQQATGDILYFLHVDTFPPKNFDQLLINSIANNASAGCFRMKFNSQSWFLQFFAWFTRFNILLCRGGDQSLFITKTLFDKLEGFNTEYVVYEDNEFISRIYKCTTFTILPQYVITSARKYKEKGTFKLQYHFARIHLLRYLGAGPQKLHKYYKANIASA